MGPVPAITRTPDWVHATRVAPLGIEERPLAEIVDPPPDPVGFTLAGAVLAGMVAATAYNVWRVTNAWQRLARLDPNPESDAKTWAVPVLALLGLGVAAYLAARQIELQQLVNTFPQAWERIQSTDFGQLVAAALTIL